MEGGQRHVGELGEMSKEEETFKEVLKISDTVNTYWDDFLNLFLTI